MVKSTLLIAAMLLLKATADSAISNSQIFASRVSTVGLLMRL